MTPLTDLREVRELFYTYETRGVFYAGPNGVAQSELYLYLLYQLSQSLAGSGNDGIMLAVGIFESISVLIQLIAFHIVYSTTPKKAPYATAALTWIIFNPISLASAFAQLGTLNDCLFYLLFMLPLLGDS